MTTLNQQLAPGTDLGGVAEIAETLGTKATNVTTWISRRATNGFPEPLVQLRMGGVFDLAVVRAWADKNVRRPRRVAEPV